MEAIKELVWPIAAFGFVGGLIDFVIGRAGQEKVKEFLLRWWVAFDDVKLKNFGKEEADQFLRFITRWVGAHFYSWKRIASFLMLTLCLSVIWICITFIIHNNRSHLVLLKDATGYCRLCYNIEHHYMTTKIAIFNLLFWVASFIFGMSFVIIVAKITRILCSKSGLHNFTIFVILFILNYLQLCLIVPIIEEFKYDITNAYWLSYSITDFISEFKYEWTNTWFLLKKDISFLPTYLYEMYRYKREFDVFIYEQFAYAPVVIRVLFSTIFLGSFILKPLVVKPTSLLWRRLIESDKPAFTLVFSGLGVLATAVGEIGKHF